MDETAFSSQLKELCGEKIESSKWRDKEYTDGSLRGYKGILIKNNIDDLCKAH